MEAAFWRQRWADNQIGFHEAEPHPLLREHWSRLGLTADNRVFVPLCGKSRDLPWLRAQGHAIVGNELAEIAVRDFFREHDMAATQTRVGEFEVFSSAGYELLCGDYFALTTAAVGPFAAIYDRAALIALPPAMRRDYAAKLSQLAQRGTRMLLITVDYDLSVLTPPPFAVSADDVTEHYRAAWDIEDCGQREALVKGLPGTEQGFVLTRR